MQFYKKFYKDLGDQSEKMDALPYAVVGGAWEGSFTSPLAHEALRTVLNHIVPHGRQLKILFMRVWTEESSGAKFRVFQSNPVAAGATGTVEAYPVLDATPSGARDYPFLESPGAEMAHGSLIDPIHVLEGSITFDIVGYTPSPATGSRYGFVWWGVQKDPEKDRVDIPT